MHASYTFQCSPEHEVALQRLLTFAPIANPTLQKKKPSRYCNGTTHMGLVIKANFFSVKFYTEFKVRLGNSPALSFFCCTFYQNKYKTLVNRVTYCVLSMSFFLQRDQNNEESFSFWVTKGQLISKCPFGVFKSPKKPTIFVPGFLPQPLKRGQIKKVVYEFLRLGQKSLQKFRWLFG